MRKNAEKKGTAPAKVVPEEKEQSKKSSTNNMSKKKQTVKKEEQKEEKKSKKSKKKFLTMESSVKTISLKFYEEQIPNGIEALFETIRCINPNKLHALGIVHDDDPATDDVWAPTREKPHIHVIVKVLKNSLKLRTILKALGIVYRKPEDESLWKNHGVETCVNFPNMVVYLTHETQQAIKDGKTQYALSKIVTNVPEMLNRYRDIYFNVDGDTGKVDDVRMSELDRIASEKGYNLEDFDNWFKTLSLNERKNIAMKEIKHSYDIAAQERLSTNPRIRRCCIFIKGEANIGKTYTSLETLISMDKNPYVVKQEGTGKFDNLRISNKAILIDDTTCPNLLNLCDNYICKTYRRNSNNPIWSGDMFVVASNYSFEDWLRTCGINEIHFEPMHTRFYECEILRDENNKRFLYVSSPANRGSDEDTETDSMFLEFQRIFSSLIQEYTPKDKKVTRNLNKDYILEPEKYTSFEEAKENCSLFDYNTNYKLYLDEEDFSFVGWNYCEKSCNLLIYHDSGFAISKDKKALFKIIFMSQWDYYAEFCPDKYAELCDEAKDAEIPENVELEFTVMNALPQVKTIGEWSDIADLIDKLKFENSEIQRKSFDKLEEITKTWHNNYIKNKEMKH